MSDALPPPRRLADCHKIDDFRALARRRLPSPVFHYIDGAADDEATRARNRAAFEEVDLVPRVLAGVAEVDPSVTVLGRRSPLPLMLSPTALQRLFHWQGERAVARAADQHGLWFGVSSLSTVAVEEIAALSTAPKMFQFYHHRDAGLNAAMIARAREAGFDALTLTVDTIVGGNRERCKRTGFTSPPRITPRTALSYAARPAWGLNYLTRERFRLPHLDGHVAEGSRVVTSVGAYFDTMLDPSLDWDRAARLKEEWGGRFCLKGVMAVEDARRAVELGADAIMVSNHGGRQLDGGRAPFDQLDEIVQAVGGEIEVVLDGGVTRGTHVLKALSLGATAVSGGRLYLYALAAAGQAGVERALELLSAEIVRGMKLMGARRVADLSRDSVRRR